jgi:hypothetical protein
LPDGASLGSIKAGVARIESDVKAARNFTLYIEKLIETQQISTTNITESARKINNLIATALMDAVWDVEIAY